MYKDLTHIGQLDEEKEVPLVQEGEAKQAIVAFYQGHHKDKWPDEPTEDITPPSSEDEGQVSPGDLKDKVVKRIEDAAGHDPSDPLCDPMTLHEGYALVPDMEQILDKAKKHKHQK